MSPWGGKWITYQFNIQSASIQEAGKLPNEEAAEIPHRDKGPEHQLSIRKKKQTRDKMVLIEVIMRWGEYYEQVLKVEEVREAKMNVVVDIGMSMYQVYQ